MVQVFFLYNCNAAEVAVNAYGPCVARVLTYGRTSTDKGQLMCHLTLAQTHIFCLMITANYTVPISATHRAQTMGDGWPHKLKGNLSINFSCCNNNHPFYHL